MTRRNWKQYFADNLQQACAPLIDPLIHPATRRSVGNSVGNATRQLKRAAWTAMTTTPGIAPTRYLRKLSVWQSELQLTTLMRDSLRTGKLWCRD